MEEEEEDVSAYWLSTSPRFTLHDLYARGQVAVGIWNTVRSASVDEFVSGRSYWGWLR